MWASKPHGDWDARDGDEDAAEALFGGWGVEGGAVETLRREPSDDSPLDRVGPSGSGHGGGRGALRVGRESDPATLGIYRPAERTILIAPRAVLGTAVHEYVHHLQNTLPGFQSVFRHEHRRRTTSSSRSRHPLEASRYRGGKAYRRDDYVDEYFGRDYGPAPLGYDTALTPDGDALEVPTRAFQTVLHTIDGTDMLNEMARLDPRMLDIVLGLLLRFDP